MLSSRRKLLAVLFFLATTTITIEKVNGRGYFILKSAAAKCCFFEATPDSQYRIHYEKLEEQGPSPQQGAVGGDNNPVRLRINQHGPDHPAGRRSGFGRWGYQQRFMYATTASFDARHSEEHELKAKLGWVPVKASGNSRGGKVELCLLPSPATNGLRPLLVALHVEDDLSPAEDMKKLMEEQDAAHQEFQVMENTVRTLIRKMETALAFSRAVSRDDADRLDDILQRNRGIKWYPMCQLLVVILTGLIQAIVVARFLRRNYVGRW